MEITIRGVAPNCTITLGAENAAERHQIVALGETAKNPRKRINMREYETVLVFRIESLPPPEQTSDATPDEIVVSPQTMKPHSNLTNSDIPNSTLFGALPLPERIDALTRAWIGAAKSLKNLGRLAEAQRLEMCSEEVRMILNSPMNERTHHCVEPK